jgi:hypothetical protein
MDVHAAGVCRRGAHGAAAGSAEGEGAAVQ